MQHKKEQISYLHAFILFILILAVMGMLQEPSAINLTKSAQYEEHLSFPTLHSLPDIHLPENHSQDYFQEPGELRLSNGFFLSSYIFTSLFLLIGTSYWLHRYRFFCGNTILHQIISFIQNTDGEKGLFFGFQNKKKTYEKEYQICQENNGLLS